MSNYRCDCGSEEDVCEHLIALFYAIKDKNEIADGTTKTVKTKITKTQKEPKIPKKSNKPETFVQLLERVPVDQLRAFLKESFSRNQQFKSLFMVYFANETSGEGAEKYNSMVENAIKTGMGRRQYASTSDVKKMLKPLNMIEKQGEAFLATKKFGEAKFLVQALAVKLLYIYDSVGDQYEIGEVITSAFGIMEKILNSNEAPLELKKDTRTWLENFIADSSLYRNDDASSDAIKILIRTAQKQQDAVIFTKKIVLRYENLISSKSYSRSNKDFYQKYYNQKMLSSLFQMYNKLGMEMEFENLKNANQHLPYLNQILNQFQM